MEGDAWGVSGDLLLNDNGSPDINDDEIDNTLEDGNMEGWDVSSNSISTIKSLHN